MSLVAAAPIDPSVVAARGVRGSVRCAAGLLLLAGAPPPLSWPPRATRVFARSRRERRSGLDSAKLTAGRSADALAAGGGPCIAGRLRRTRTVIAARGASAARGRPAGRRRCFSAPLAQHRASARCRDGAESQVWPARRCTVIRAGTRSPDTTGSGSTGTSRRRRSRARSTSTLPFGRVCGPAASYVADAGVQQPLVDAESWPRSSRCVTGSTSIADLGADRGLRAGRSPATWTIGYAHFGQPARTTEDAPAADVVYGRRRARRVRPGP